MNVELSSAVNLKGYQMWGNEYSRIHEMNVIVKERQSPTEPGTVMD